MIIFMTMSCDDRISPLMNLSYVCILYLPMHIFYDHELSCYFFNSCLCWNIGTSNLDLKLATIIFHNIDATKVVRPDRRRTRSCGGSLIRTCLAQRKAASCTLTPTAWGGCSAAGSRPGTTVAAPWCAHPAVPPGHGGSLSSHRAQGATVGFRETPGASHAMRVVLCPLMILTQRIGSIF